MPLPVLHQVTAGDKPEEKFYIKTSDVYETIKTIVGIQKVADPKGTEEVLTVKEALRTGAIWRIGIRYKDTSGKMKSSHLLVSKKFVGALFANDPTGKLENKDYKIGTVTKGKIESISGVRKASFS